MSDLILHQYAASPFSEKVRALLAYKKLAYQWVDIPVIMPKPDLMPLTGGYRKTPVMQLGADIFCDTAVICRLIDQLAPENTIYPAEHAASLQAIAHWTDTFFFKVSVAKVFQPKVLATHPLFSDPEGAKAFVEDRMKLREGVNEAPLALAEAEIYFSQHLNKLNQQLNGVDFMFGDKPTIADFSTYHCIWFVHNNEILQSEFDAYPNVLSWLTSMRAMGHGDATQIDGAAALAQAKAATPDNSMTKAEVNVDEFNAGDQVSVLPIDYGFQASTGELLSATEDELVIRRQDAQTGDVAVHFPRLGFQIQSAS